MCWSGHLPDGTAQRARARTVEDTLDPGMCIRTGYEAGRLSISLSRVKNRAVFVEKRWLHSKCMVENCRLRGCCMQVASWGLWRITGYLFFRTAFKEILRKFITLAAEAE